LHLVQTTPTWTIGFTAAGRASLTETDTCTCPWTTLLLISAAEAKAAGGGAAEPNATADHGLTRGPLLAQATVGLWLPPSARGIVAAARSSGAPVGVIACAEVVCRWPEVDGMQPIRGW